MDVRQVIAKRLTALEWSNYQLVQALNGKVARSTVYEFLAGKYEIKTDQLGHMLDVLGLVIVPKPPRTAARPSRRRQT